MTAVLIVKVREKKQCHMLVMLCDGSVEIFGGNRREWVSN